MREHFEFAFPIALRAGLVIAVYLLGGSPALFQSLAADEAAEVTRTRLALCASGDEKAVAMAALAEVELSRRDDVVLLVLGEKRGFKVLGESSEPMNAKAMIEAMTAKGYWSSPGGKTPHATL